MTTDPADLLPLFSQPTVLDVRSATLVLLLLVAATIDMRTMRIPNWLTATGALIGLVFSAAIPGEMLGARWAVEGLLWALGGMAVGLAVLLPLYALRVMGAGDVKLMAMVGAFLGLQQIVPAVLSVFIAGGVVALAVTLYRRALRRVAANVGDAVSSMAFAILSGTRPDPRVRGSIGTVPYGISICAGTIAWVTASYLGYV